MVKKLICFIWGCRIRDKAYTGNTQAVVGPLGNEYTVLLYKWEYNKRCPRCGKEL